MIDLYTAPTPNGYKISIALEEMALPYELHHVDLRRDEQKAPEYLRINPNGRIPAIVDRDNDGFAVFESGAILVYLAEKSGMLLPRDAKNRSTALQWLMFQMGGVGPMFGQAFVFVNYFPEHIAPVISHYQNESRRLLGVLDRRLGEAAYLGGDEYSIADIATWPWVQGCDRFGVETTAYPNLRRWSETVSDRPAVRRGREIPAAYEDSEAARRERAGALVMR